MDRRALLASLASGFTASTSGCLSGFRSELVGSDPSQGSRFAVTDFSVAAEKVAPTSRYVLDVTGFYSGKEVGQRPDASVVEVTDIDDHDVRNAIADAIGDGGLETNWIPDGLGETVERYDFFTWGSAADRRTSGTYFGLELYRLHPDRDPTVEFDATTEDGRVSPDDPGVVTFTVRNVGDETERLYGGPAPPFGVLRAEAVETDTDHSFYLWRDYERDGCITRTDDDGLRVCSVSTTTPLQPAAALSKSYELRVESTALEPGRYEVSGRLHYAAQQGAPKSVVEWVASFALERP